MTALRTAFATTGWGLFCACSWTWCIGMFLPVLLLERFGWPGFLVFAVPNVLGCAAFGYVVGRAGVTHLRLAGLPLIRLFSLVTIGFHLFFAGLATAWLLQGQPGWRATAVVAALLLFALAKLLSLAPLRAWPWIAAATYAISLACFAVIGLAPLEHVAWSGTQPPSWLWLTAPTIAFGFLLCPYLDATFQRARLVAPSRHAFAIFGAAFSVMILMTCAYAALPVGLARAAIAVHFTVQGLFTVAAHLRELDAPDMQPSVTRRASRRWLPIGAVVAVLLGLLPFEAGVDMYLRWLVFYGLVFPAAVLLLVRPNRDPGYRTLSEPAFVALMLILAIFDELGFLWGMPWLLPIPVIVIAGTTFSTVWRSAPWRVSTWSENRATAGSTVMATTRSADTSGR